LSGKSDLYAIGAAVSLTLFAFLGIESATVPAANVKNPQKTIPRATMIGTVITLVIYMLSSISIMGMIAPKDLAISTAPLADAAYIIWGDNGQILIGLGAMVSTFGALNGWILVQGQMPLAMAEDNMFPPVFKKLSKRKFPLTGMLISSGLITMVILANQAVGLVKIFTILVLMSTFLSLITYLFSSMSEVLILLNNKKDGWQVAAVRAFFLSIPVFLFSLWAIYGSGAEIVFYGFISLMLGTPFYVWSKIEQNKRK
jgi:basic amino acid/polyamine antiporter, APA family